MGGRKRSIKFKILTLVLVPLISLTGIWVFAASITAADGVSLFNVQAVHKNLVIPIEDVALQLQHERYESLAFLGSPSRGRAGLDAQRVKTDQARAWLEQKATDEGVQDSTALPIYQRIVELIGTTRRLPDIRARVDARNFTPLLTLDAYRLMLESVARVYDGLLIGGDLELGQPTRGLTLVDRSRELMSQQAALLAASTGAGGMTAEEHSAFAAMIIKRRLLYDMGFQLLDDELRQPYIVLQNSPAYTKFASIEDQVSLDVQAGKPLPAASANWGAAIQALSIVFDRQTGVAADRIAERAAPIAAGILWRIGAAAILGLVGIGLSLWVSVRFGRRITAELVQLQYAALELASLRLPNVVARLRRGEDVDVAAESPPIVTGTTNEVISVGQAFTSVQTTAIEAAVGQAEIRKGVGKVFLNLARRNQSLLHRQLTMLDAMERRVTDPELLDELFGIDHLTTRMRRHAEGLIILSGAVPGRGWRSPVPLYDVVRAAVEEVEDYLRVQVTLPEDMALSGASATDVIHLLAELVENATIFSPPHTHVEVRGEAVARGFVIEIEDRGLGMSPEEMEQINQRLANPPEFDLADSDRLGLFVVGRLASRRGIRVSLRVSPYGGTTAIVLIPDSLVTPSEPSPRPLYSVEQITALDTAPGDGREGGRQGSGFGARTGRDLTVASGSVAGQADARGQSPGSGAGRAQGGQGSRATLPHRVRQANLAPQLREAAPPPGEAPERVAKHSAGPRDDPDARPLQPSPDMFSSFRAGWQQARDSEEDRP